MSSLPFRLLAITPPSGEVSTSVVDAWIESGVEEVGLAVLLRTPGAPVDASLQRFGRLRERCRARGISLLLSCEAADLEALSLPTLGLAGAQIRSDPDEATVSRARMKVGSALLGRSVHEVPPPAAVSYSVFGPVFAPKTAQAGAGKKAKGVAVLAEICKARREPVLALGGLDAGRARACLDAGAAGLAGISAFFGRTETVVETVSAFVATLRDGTTT